MKGWKNFNVCATLVIAIVLLTSSSNPFLGSIIGYSHEDGKGYEKFMHSYRENYTSGGFITKDCSDNLVFNCQWELCVYPKDHCGCQYLRF